MTTASEIVHRFRGLRALVLGDVMLDSYLEGTAARLCSEGPVPVVHKTGERRVPGGAANTAANVVALGAGAIVLGLVGEDAAGERLRATLRYGEIDDRWLVADPHMATVHKLRILADGQYVVRFDEGEKRPCSDAAARRLRDGLDRAFPRCDLVIISDYGYGVVAPPLVERLRALRAARPCTLVIDSKNLSCFDRAGATAITPNHREALFATSGTYDGAPRPADDAFLPAMERAGRQLLECVDAEYAMVTLAERGVLVVPRRAGADAVHVPTHQTAQVHDVGAGDSFTAALALALAAGADPADGARIGVDAAGIAITKRWTAVVRQQELLQRVSLRDAWGHRPRGAGTELAALIARLDDERRAGRTIVFTNGVFDIVHAGHVEFLRQARRLGDVLVVGVNSDRGAWRLKGENRPINNERDRLALVAALDAVDAAMLFDEDTPAATIRALRPHIHVKGGDYRDEAIPEAEAVDEVGGRVVILPLAGSLSTSGLIERIISTARDDTSPRRHGDTETHGAFEKGAESSEKGEEPSLAAVPDEKYPRASLSLRASSAPAAPPCLRGEKDGRDG